MQSSYQITLCVSSDTLFLGDIYSGLADGHIIRIDKDLKAFTTILRTGSDSEKCGKKGQLYKFEGAVATKPLETLQVKGNLLPS